MEYAQRCLALDESFSDAHTTVGLVHLVMRQWEKAIEECELAVSLNPNSKDFSYKDQKILVGLKECLFKVGLK